MVFGKAGGFASAIEASALNGADGFQINGEAAGDFSGTSVASAGDVNGDGFDDLIIGAKYADPNGSVSGASYVVFGKAGGFTSTIQLSALSGADGFQINGVAATDEVGVSVASAGDVNGDGFADLFIGAKYADPNGASYVVFGKAAAFGATIELSSLDGLSGFRIDGKSANDRSGFPVASAGDIDGDGFADLIVGAYGADYNGSSSGASYVVFGKAGGFTFKFQLSTLNGANGFQINGEAAGDYSGFSVAGAGDVNGDGFDVSSSEPKGPFSTTTRAVPPMWCSARPEGLTPPSSSRPSMVRTASASTARRSVTAAVSPSPAPAMSTATASPT